MGVTIELSDDLVEQIDKQLKEDESYEEFIEAIVNHYVAEGRGLWEGYGGPP